MASRSDHAALDDDRTEHHAAAQDRRTLSFAVRKLRKTEFRDKANALLEQVGLKGFGSRYPWQLSGGMLQRANLCRALIHEPRMLLLDEALWRARSFTREELWSILQDLWIAHKPTVLLVTHDLRRQRSSEAASA
ncbi:ATP-binding cassette domain-containing protein [Bradyrhizobium sp. TZ2]